MEIWASSAHGIGRGWFGATLGVLVIALLLPLATFLVAVWLLGSQLMTVQTGSMSPTFGVGSLLVVGAVDPTDVLPGMAITFVDPAAPDRLVAHRVVAIAPGPDLVFITKGDANATPDPAPVPARMVRGRILWQVPGIGIVFEWLEWPSSFLLLVVGPGALLAVLEFRSRTQRRRRPLSS